MMGRSLARRMPGSLGAQLGQMVMDDDLLPGQGSAPTRQRRWEHSPPAEGVNPSMGINSPAVMKNPNPSPSLPSAGRMPMPSGAPAQMPGVIGGFGGGTFNMDGSQATSVQAAPPTGRPDYAALLNEALGPEPKMNTGQKIASIVGPALMAFSGNQAGAAQMTAAINARRNQYDAQRQENALTGIKWSREDDLADEKRNTPQYFSGNEDRVRFDPATGQAERVYDAPQDFEDYANAQGFDTGTPEYAGAVQDYVLHANGPTAFKYDRDIEAVRNANRLATEAARQQNRIGLENVRQGNRAATRGMPTYRDLNPPAPRAAAPRAPRAAAGGRQVRGPNGQMISVFPKNGQWVDAQGRPIQ